MPEGFNGSFPHSQTLLSMLISAPEAPCPFDAQSAASRRRYFARQSRPARRAQAAAASTAAEQRAKREGGQSNTASSQKLARQATLARAQLTFSIGLQRAGVHHKLSRPGDNSIDLVDPWVIFFF